MFDDKIIEKPKRHLNFHEQLEAQVNLCRESFSNPLLPLTPAVDALEALHWKKLSKEKTYLAKLEELKRWFDSEVNSMKMEKSGRGIIYADWEVEQKSIPIYRKLAEEKFKAIMAFVDFGEDNG